jgi:hypothetical protein
MNARQFLSQSVCRDASVEGFCAVDPRKGSNSIFNLTELVAAENRTRVASAMEGCFERIRGVES